MTEPDGIDWLALQFRAVSEFGRRVAAVTDWEAPTPDTDWNVRDLVSHVVEEQQWVPQLLAGRSQSETEHAIDPLRNDLVGEWDLYSFAATAAWNHADLSTTVHLSRDSVPASQYLREHVSDVAIHTWDLARATGSDEHLDDELVRAVWSVFAPHRDDLAATGLYASPVAVPDNAPVQDQLIAVTGRDPRATP